MQMPTWARRKPGQDPAPAKTKPAAKAATSGPTIRDDAWWIERMQAWQQTKPEGAIMPRGKLAFWLHLDVEQKANDGDPTIPKNLDYILERWVEGEEFTALAEYLTEKFGFTVRGAQLRTTITQSTEGLAKYNEARRHRAHREVELARREAEMASRSGDYRFAADFRLKLAAKMLPEEYGDKSQIEIGGIKGKPLETTVVQSPADAYKAVLAGGIIEAQK